VEGLELERQRRELYSDLWKIVQEIKTDSDPAPDQYRGIRDLLRDKFERGMSDTTRPDNDTSLWEHVYSVTSIAKAIHIRLLLEGKKLEEIKQADKEKATGRERTLYRICGIGFDGLGYLATAHKIGDVVGRRRVIERVFDAVRDLLEYQLPFGNEIYRDGDCLLFLTPALSEEWEDSHPVYGDLEAEVRARVAESS
jgi:hypothetical protein